MAASQQTDQGSTGIDPNSTQEPLGTAASIAGTGTQQTAMATDGGTGADKTTSTDSKSSTKDSGKWYDSLPDDLKMEKSLHNFKSLEDATRAFVSAQKLVGRDKITVPDPKTATPEEFQAVFKKLGLPEDVKEFNVDLGQDHGLDEGFLAKVKEQAHKTGILPKQLEGILKWYSEESKAIMSQHAKAQQEEHLKAHANLRNEWGNAFEQNITAAKLALQDGATPEEMKYLADNKMTENPVLIRIFAKLGQALKEGELKHSGSGGFGKGHIAPEQAMAEAHRIMGDANHAYNSPTHPGHQAALLEVERLMKDAYPDKKNS